MFGRAAPCVHSQQDRLGVGLEGVEFGEHAEQHGHAERDRDRGEQQPGERLPSAVQREPQAEPDHQRKPP